MSHAGAKLGFLVLVLLQVGSLAMGQGSMAPWPSFPEHHLQGISRNWPTPFPGGYPPNHDIDVSGGWSHELATSVYASHSKSLSAHWPANHFRDLSNDWGGDTEFPDHLRAISRGFNHVPNHVSTVSDGWSHGVTTSSFNPHQKSVSQHWPSGHIRANSCNNVPADPEVSHIQSISASWGEGGHSVEYSAYWPTNHVVQISRTYPSGHHRGMSAAFPPSHHHAVSKGWAGPTGWPTNHAKSLSLEWDGPYPEGWTDFPSNHDWFTSAKDLAGLAATIGKLLK